jgi:hypothetical protein
MIYPKPVCIIRNCDLYLDDYDYCSDCPYRLIILSDGTKILHCDEVYDNGILYPETDEIIEN